MIMMMMVMMIKNVRVKKKNGNLHLHMLFYYHRMSKKTIGLNTVAVYRIDNLPCLITLLTSSLQATVLNDTFGVALVLNISNLSGIPLRQCQNEIKCTLDMSPNN